VGATITIPQGAQVQHIGWGEDSSVTANLSTTSINFEDYVSGEIKFTSAGTYRIFYRWSPKIGSENILYLIVGDGGASDGSSGAGGSSDTGGDTAAQTAAGTEDKGGADTGINNVAVFGGVVILAVGAVAFSRKKRN
jgi:LPXTG-motif cell wall-anchored protein